MVQCLASVKFYNIAHTHLPSHHTTMIKCDSFASLGEAHSWFADALDYSSTRQPIFSCPLHHHPGTLVHLHYEYPPTDRVIPFYSPSPFLWPPSLPLDPIVSRSHLFTVGELSHGPDMRDSARSEESHWWVWLSSFRTLSRPTRAGRKHATRR